MALVNPVTRWQVGITVSILAVGGGIIYARKAAAAVSDAPRVPAGIFQEPQKPQRCLVVGAGTIGASFSSVFLARGMYVVCMDPFVTREKLEQRITACWPVLVSRGMTKLPNPPFEALTKTDSLEDALSNKDNDGTKTFDFVQECSWEDVEHKQKILGELDAALDPSILIASSTSFIPWELLVGQCQRKHRIMIGHPALPHLLSFMEIYGSVPEWANHCQEWYTAAGFDVIVMRATIPGHVFNSFLRVNMDHGQSLVRQGVCSPEDVQKAMRHLGRDMYAGQMFLSLLMAIGGDRGVEGGKELGKRIRNDAVYLVLFSALKKRGAPDFLAIPCSKYLGRFISNSLLPQAPEEWLEAAKQFEKDITKNGQIPPQVAMHQASSKKYELIPLEVGNDPLRYNP